jgi:hypothetical protein
VAVETEVRVVMVAVDRVEVEWVEMMAMVMTIKVHV